MFRIFQITRYTHIYAMEFNFNLAWISNQSEFFSFYATVSDLCLNNEQISKCVFWFFFSLFFSFILSIFKIWFFVCKFHNEDWTWLELGWFLPKKNNILSFYIIKSEHKKKLMKWNKTTTHKEKRISLIRSWTWTMSRM